MTLLLYPSNEKSPRAAENNNLKVLKKESNPFEPVKLTCPMQVNNTKTSISKIQKINTSLSILNIILTIGPKTLVTLRPNIIQIQTHPIVSPVTSPNHTGKLEFTNLLTESYPEGVPNLSVGSDIIKAI